MKLPMVSLSIAFFLVSPSVAQDRLKLPPPALTPRPPVSTDPTVRDISSLLDPIIREHKVPAMAAAIIKDNKTLALGVAGVRKSGDPTRATIDDKWHIGSDTKAMTATLCAVLVEENTLRWDQTLAETFPDLAETMDAAWKPVTLEQLLTNRAGAPANLDRDGLWMSLWNFQGAPTQARRALLEGVVKHPPEHAPGTKFLYSNAGYAIAGHMAEKVTGSSWEDLMIKKVFDPLQMFTVGFGAPGTKAPGTPAKRDNVNAPPGGYKPDSGIDQPRGHRAFRSPVEPGPTADNPVAIGPAGTVHCSIGDWAKFISLHLRGDPQHPSGGEFKIILTDTMTKLHTPGAGPDGKTDGDYAMGWGVTTRAWAATPGNPGRVLTHSGSNTMWYCTTWVAPEKDFAVLITCNQGGDAAVKACDQAASMLIREAAR